MTLANHYLCTYHLPHYHLVSDRSSRKGMVERHLDTRELAFFWVAEGRMWVSPYVRKLILLNSVRFHSSVFTLYTHGWSLSTCCYAAALKSTCFGQQVLSKTGNPGISIAFSDHVFQICALQISSLRQQTLLLEMRKGKVANGWDWISRVNSHSNLPVLVLVRGRNANE